VEGPLRLKVEADFEQFYNNMHPWHKPVYVPGKGHATDENLKALVAEKFPELRLHMPIDLAVEAFHRVTGFPHRTIEKYANLIRIEEKVDKAITEIKKDVYRRKLPLIKEIVGLTLEGVKEAVQGVIEDKERLRSFSPREIRDLTMVAAELNNILRLETGQSTQNISNKTHITETTSQSVSVILKDLKEIDPVFEYPEVPDEQ
jgi:hypothetical protein